ncbi:hypothetical protein KUH03_06840 [Sphingobacterium sp. E70]|uniref:hypothetical protein n=1 Tax=Sphingobacterium sp. E70 TaxID=2853439 RepID=UPI00211CF3F7|nr:hypothetical protein [Sphingobacterium sp. E70]ULT26565.1 hypothetical protein KUH03_06840 [Sphingobacterium sp. E70]
MVQAYTAAFSGTAPGTGNSTNIGATPNSYLLLGGAGINPFTQQLVQLVLMYGT